MNCHAPIADTAVPVKPSSRVGCPRCGIIEGTRKVSCCADGGSWVNNCGVVGDSKFEHTWKEGILACKNVVSLRQEEAQPQIRLRYETTQMNSNSEQNRSQPDIVESSVDSVFDTEIENCEGCVTLSKITSFISVVLVIMYSRMQ